MTWAFDVYYLPPSDSAREARIETAATERGGRSDFRDAPEQTGSHNVCLTFEFEMQGDAEIAANDLRRSGEFVEGPYPYS